MLQVLQIFVHAIGEEDLTTTTRSASSPTALHFIDLLSAGHPDLLRLQIGLLFLHAIEFSLMTSFFALSFFPFLKGNFSHDLHVFFSFLLLLFKSFFLLLLHQLLPLVITLFDEAVLEPPLERLLAFLILKFLFELLSLLLSLFFFQLECIREQLSFFPGKHTLVTSFIFDLKLGLLLHELLKKVTFCFGNESLAQIPLMLLQTKPLVMRKFRLSSHFSVLINDGSVESAHAFCILVFFFTVLSPFESDTFIAIFVGFNLLLSDFIQALEQFLILKVFALFLIETVLIEVATFFVLLSFFVLWLLSV